MNILKAYKYRLALTPAQHERMLELVGCARWVWNAALAECLRMLDADERLPGYNGYGGYASWITYWKAQPESAFLQSAYTDNLQQKLRDLDRAWKDCFDKAQPNKKRPTFKAKNRDEDNSIRFVNFTKYCQLENRRVKLPAGLGWCRIRRSAGSAKSRPTIEGDIKNCTISRHAGHWYISFQVEQLVPEPVHPSKSGIGIDMGVSKLLALSDGTHIEPANHYRRRQKQLAHAQRDLARKQRFSSNWKKQKGKIARLNAHIANCRRDYLHKATTQLSKNHAMIVIEDLQVANMTASAKGTMEKPGRRVRQKAGLNKAILDQGWYEARRQLTYKQLWRGGQLIAVPAPYTSQRCSACGHVAAENRPSQARFCCVACGFQENADTNAARNILAAGHAVLACGELAQQGRSTKQEPVRTRKSVAPLVASAA
jgi:putative transposase